jgi:hypothetical protein
MQVDFINADEHRMNELVFSDNLYSVNHFTLISEDIAYVVYNNLYNKPNAKGNIFIAAFTTSHARLHLYKAVEKLGTRALYMDTDSVVFKHRPGLWKPILGKYLGEWTNEIKTGSKIVKFVACGPKNYSYETVNSEGNQHNYVKVKGLCLSAAASAVVTTEVMEKQVSTTMKRCINFTDAPPPPKKICLAEERNTVNVENTKTLNQLYASTGIKPCLTFNFENIVCGPCNCAACKSKILVPQIQFKKHRREGFIETVQIVKEYRLVINKRWIVPDSANTPIPTLTLPFGF